MRIHTHLGLALAASALMGLAAPLEARALMIAGAPRPGMLAANADIILLGKVTEIEKDTVEATQFKGAPKDQKVTYKIAVVKLEESIMGGKGLTQFRVGFPADAGADLPAVGGPPGGGLRPIRPIRGGFGPVALTAGQEGVFFLTSHHSGDFYTLASNGTAPVMGKKDENYAKSMEEVKKVIKTIEDPVAALKAKEIDDRFAAALLLIQRYQTPKAGGGVITREAIPEEENKLIVALLKELPWVPTDLKPRTGSDPTPPSRSALWNQINAQEFGFKQPNFNAKPGTSIDYNKVMGDATAAYLKDNADKIKIKRYAK